MKKYITVYLIVYFVILTTLCGLMLQPFGAIVLLPFDMLAILGGSKIAGYLFVGDHPAQELQQEELEVYRKNCFIYSVILIVIFLFIVQVIVKSGFPVGAREVIEGIGGISAVLKYSGFGIFAHIGEIVVFVGLIITIVLSWAFLYFKYYLAQWIFQGVIEQSEEEESM